MHFIKELKEREFDDEAYLVAGRGYRQFEPFRVNPNLWLSIQASYAHYSKPRITNKDLYVYTHWEFALFTKNDFVTVTEVLPNFSSLAEIEIYEQQVYGFVPTDLVNELYKALFMNELEKLK